jgi:hypothetical protein
LLRSRCRAEGENGRLTGKSNLEPYCEHIVINTGNESWTDLYAHCP